MAQGGKGVVIPGCPACRKRLFTMQNFIDHLADDVLEGLIVSLAPAQLGINAVWG
jgi:hypothetical protein